MNQASHNANWSAYIDSLQSLIQIGPQADAKRDEIDKNQRAQLAAADERMNRAHSQVRRLADRARKTAVHAEEEAQQLSDRDGPASPISAPTPNNVDHAHHLIDQFTRYLTEAASRLAMAKSRKPAPPPRPAPVPAPVAQPSPIPWIITAIVAAITIAVLIVVIT